MKIDMNTFRNASNSVKNKMYQELINEYNKLVTESNAKIKATQAAAEQYKRALEKRSGQETLTNLRSVAAQAADGNLKKAKIIFEWIKEPLEISG